MRTQTREGERGVALVLVLWLLALLAAIAIGVASTLRTEIGLARNLVAQAEAQHLAQAGILQAVLNLLDPQTAPAPMGTLVAFDGTVTVQWRDECGKVDLNTGWGRLVTGLLAAHAGPERGFALGQAVLDWRDPDHRRRPEGAEDEDYAAAGRPYGARDGVFEGVDELQQVLGMAPQTFRRLADDVTVDCLNGGVEPLAASASVLAAIPGPDPAAIPLFMEDRDRALAAGASLPQLDGGGTYVEPGPGQAYGIVATARHPSGLTARWEAVVWITGDASRPYVLRTWRRHPWRTY